MSFKGAKKALARAPHQLRHIGDKTTDDKVVTDWSKDIATTVNGLTFITGQIGIHVKAWRDMQNRNEEILELYEELYRDLPTDLKKEDLSINETPREHQITPSITMKQLQDYRGMCNSVKVATEPLLGNLETLVVLKCKEMALYLQEVEKSLKKRGHKKIDYERFTETVEKLHDKSESEKGLTDKEKESLQKAEIELDEASDVFFKLDAKLRKGLPQCFSQITEFLYITTSIVYQTEVDIFRIWKENFELYTQRYGHRMTETPQDYEDICHEWENDFESIQTKTEALQHISNGNVIKTPIWKHTKSDKIKRELTLAMTSTIAATSNVVKKTVKQDKVHLDMKTMSITHNVEPTDQSEGMFKNDADPLQQPFNFRRSTSTYLPGGHSSPVSIPSRKHVPEVSTPPLPGVPPPRTSARNRSMSSSSTTSTVSNISGKSISSWNIFRKASSPSNSSSPINGKSLRFPSIQIPTSHRTLPISRSRYETPKSDQTSITLVGQKSPGRKFSISERSFNFGIVKPSETVLGYCPITTTFEQDKHDTHNIFLARALTSC